MISNDATPGLKPVPLWYACTLLGWFLDMLKVDPDKAMRHFGRPHAHPLRGCFEPSEATAPTLEPLEYQKVRLAISGSSGVEGGCLNQTRVVLATSIFICCCPVLVQLYCWGLLKDPCKEFPGWRCQKFTFLDQYGGAYITFANLIILFLAYAVARLVYHGFRRCCRPLAMAMAQIVIMKLIDKIALERLPHTVGIREKMVMWATFALFTSFAEVATIDMNAGILAFGNMITVYLLLAGNTLFGNSASLDLLRERHILDVCASVAKETNLRLSNEEVRIKVAEWYNTKPVLDAILLDLPIVVLLANLIWFPPHEEPESVRIRKFIIPRMYPVLSDPHTTTEDIGTIWTGTVLGFENVVVDVFWRSCVVLGKTNLDCHWAQHGERLPWHFAIINSKVNEVAISLQKQGLSSGAGCFAPGHAGDYKWEEAETRTMTANILADVRQVCAEEYRLSLILVDFVRRFYQFDEEIDLPTLVKSLLKAGANANIPSHERNVKEVPEALFLTMSQNEVAWHNKETQLLEVCKLLIEAGSNIQTKCFGVSDDMTLFDRQEELLYMGKKNFEYLKQYAESLHAPRDVATSQS